MADGEVADDEVADDEVAVTDAVGPGLLWLTAAVCGTAAAGMTAAAGSAVLARALSGTVIGSL
jgi:hypothetical protein